jgi:hypothetical protein
MSQMQPPSPPPPPPDGWFRDAAMTGPGDPRLSQELMKRAFPRVIEVLRKLQAGDDDSG